LFSDHYLVALRKKTLEIILDIRFPYLILNLWRKEYKAGVITIQFVIFHIAFLVTCVVRECVYLCEGPAGYGKTKKAISPVGYVRSMQFFTQKYWRRVGVLKNTVMTVFKIYV
jgi:hypothetical protein